ncbi:unnamed protein product [Gemmataceae bacterium]|nr:unnamed protein product [Gemmataceae bacterium]VTT98873.1 unnamed protein product [Gemmataceae bacterium]
MPATFAPARRAAQVRYGVLSDGDLIYLCDTLDEALDRQCDLATVGRAEVVEMPGE